MIGIYNSMHVRYTVQIYIIQLYKASSAYYVLGIALSTRDINKNKQDSPCLQEAYTLMWKGGP